MTSQASHAGFGEKTKHSLLKGLSYLLEMPFARGRISISERVYGFLATKITIVEKRVGSNRISLDLSQQELRYFYFGAFEPDERDFLRRFLRSGDVFVDVGANFGYISAIALESIGSDGQIFAFAANPQVFQFLDTLQQSAGEAFIPYNLAVTDHTSTSAADQLCLYINPDHSMWASSRTGFTGTDQPKEIFVATVSLSDFFVTHRIPRVDMIKIDVDGAEAEV